MSGITIRRAEPRDFAAVQELQRSTHLMLTSIQSGIAIPVEDMEMQISSPNGIFGIAQSGGEVVGFIYGEKLAARWALASYFAVRPDYQGSEVYKKLGEWFIAESRNRGVKYIVSYADSDNKRLINFYKRFGFAAGDTYVEMVKEI